MWHQKLYMVSFNIINKKHCGEDWIIVMDNILYLTKVVKERFINIIPFSIFIKYIRLNIDYPNY